MLLQLQEGSLRTGRAPRAGMLTGDPDQGTLSGGTGADTEWRITHGAGGSGNKWILPRCLLSSQLWAALIRFPRLKCNLLIWEKPKREKKKKTLKERHRHTGRIKTLGGKRKARCDSEWLSGWSRGPFSWEHARVTDRPWSNPFPVVHFQLPVSFQMNN